MPTAEIITIGTEILLGEIVDTNARYIARKLRDEWVTIVSGFQSPVEKECLRILLRGKQPIIICLARSLEKIRLPAAWREALDTGRLLLLSAFEKRPRRPTVKSSHQRNELVAALSDNILIIHAEPGGSVERISELISTTSSICSGVSAASLRACLQGLTVR